MKIHEKQLSMSPKKPEPKLTGSQTQMSVFQHAVLQ